MSAEPLNPINSPTPILPPQPFATPVTVGIQPNLLLLLFKSA